MCMIKLSIATTVEREFENSYPFLCSDMIKTCSIDVVAEIDIVDNNQHRKNPRAVEMLSQ